MAEAKELPLTLGEARLLAAEIRRSTLSDPEYWPWVIEELCDRPWVIEELCDRLERRDAALRQIADLPEVSQDECGEIARAALET